MAGRIATLGRCVGLASSFIGSILMSSSPAAETRIEVRVEVAAGAPSEVAALLGDVLGEAPYRTLSRSARAALVSTNAIGLDRLSADQRFSVVAPVGGGVAGTIVAVASASTEWTIRLRTEPIRPVAAGALPAAADATARHSAAVVVERASAEGGLSEQAVGPGMLLVRALSADGGEIARTAVNDPRLIRSETVGAGGRLTGRQDFLRSDVTFTVALPADGRIATLEIAAPDEGGALRTLARVVTP